MAHLLVLLFGLVGASQCLDLNLQAASSDNVALDGRESTQGRTLEMPLYNSLATQVDQSPLRRKDTDSQYSVT